MTVEETVLREPAPDKDKLEPGIIDPTRQEPGVIEEPQEPAPAPAPGAGGQLTKAEIQAGIGAIKATALACHDQYGVAGTVMISLTIDTRGAVSEAKALGQFAGTPTGACVARVAKSAHFRAPSAPMTFTYPFVLR